jgi:hypothetical protein
MRLPDKFITSVFNFKAKIFNSRKSESRGGSRIVNGAIGHRYICELDTPWLTIEEVRDLNSWQESLEGSSQVFTAVLPILSKPRGLAFGNPKTKATINAGTKQVVLTGLEANTLSIYKAGDMFTFANHSKVYKIAPKPLGADIFTYNTNAYGDVLVYLTLTLLKSVPMYTALNFNDVVFTFAASDDEAKFKIAVKDGGYSKLSLDVEEVY